MFSAARAKQESNPSRDKIRALCALLLSRVMGQEEAVESSIIVLLAGGHLLLEGPPGVGKTSLAQAIAGIFHGSFRRIQMTSDLLPSDVLGSLRLKPGTTELEFRPGPIFSHVLLADELNRTSAKTQAALLEAMAEGKVSVDGITYSLPQPFFVVATQNPQEFHGVYPLSESQLDRFTMHINLAFPPEEAELEVYRQHGASSTRALEATEALASEELIAIRAQVARVFVEDSLIRYAQSIAHALRMVEDVIHAASIRSVLQLLDCAKARAFLKGREFVMPEDISSLAPGVLAHRLCFRSGEVSALKRKEIVRYVLERVDTPK